jgi:serine phosphatase RsbU (regulator of sigma subunit)
LSIAIAGILCIRYQLVSRSEINSRKKAEALALLSEHIRRAPDLSDIFDKAVEVVGEALKVDRVIIIPKYDSEQDKNRTVRHEWLAPGISSTLGVTLPPPLYQIGHETADVWQVPDTRIDMRIPRYLVDSYSLRSALIAPIPISSKDASLLIAHDCKSVRYWNNDETILIGAVADLIATAVEEARLNYRVLEQTATIEFIFKNAPAGIVIVNREFRVVRCNQFAANLVSMTPQEYVGKVVLGSCAADIEKQRNIYEKVFEGETIDSQYMSLPNPLSPGMYVDLRASYFPIFDQDSRPVYAGVLVENITDELEKQRELSDAFGRERRVNEILQRSLQPTVPTKLSSINMGVIYKPASVERGVGGDLLDIFPLEDDRIALVIGDVTGKGVEAAAQASLLRNLLRAFAYAGDPPKEVMRKVNSALAARVQYETLVSIFYGVVQPLKGLLTYASAGQEPPIIVRDKGARCELLYPTGVILGVDPYLTYEEKQTDIGPNDVLALITDGFVEARSRADGHLIGPDAFYECLLKGLNSKHNLQRRAEDIWTEIIKKTGSADLDDDAALLLISLSESLVAKQHIQPMAGI